MNDLMKELAAQKVERRRQLAALPVGEKLRPAPGSDGWGTLVPGGRASQHFPPGQALASLRDGGGG